MKTIDKPKFQDFHIEGVKHISPFDALKLLEKKEAVIIDVREKNEISLEGINLENILYHPMSVIMDRLKFISKDQNIIVVCPGGVRSTKTANLLNLQAYPNVANLDGGLTKWKNLGLPYKINLSLNGLHLDNDGCDCCCDPNDGESASCC